MAFGDLHFRGYWDASQNLVIGTAHEFLASGPGPQGAMYIVRQGGTYTLDGNSAWNPGDILFNTGDFWVKIPGTPGNANSQIVPKGKFLMALEELVPGAVKDLEHSMIEVGHGNAVSIAYRHTDAVSPLGALSRYVAGMWPELNMTALFECARRVNL